MLADTDAEQAVQGREDDLDRVPGRISGRAVGRRDAPAREFRCGEWPARQADCLDERGRRTNDDGEDGERGWRCQHDSEQCGQRQHGERADEHRMPAQEEAGSARGEAAQDLVRLLAEDVRLVERSPEFEEGPPTATAAA